MAVSYIKVSADTLWLHKNRHVQASLKATAPCHNIFPACKSSRLYLAYCHEPCEIYLGQAAEASGIHTVKGWSLSRAVSCLFLLICSLALETSSGFQELSRHSLQLAWNLQPSGKEGRGGIGMVLTGVSVGALPHLSATSNICSKHLWLKSIAS